MKRTAKLIAILAIIAVAFASCNQYTCPAYATDSTQGTEVEEAKS